MTRKDIRTTNIAVLIAATIALGACSSGQAIDNTVGVAAGTTKVIAKGAVGAGKLAYRGGKAILSDDD